MTFLTSWTYGQVAEGRDSSDVQTLDGKQLQEVYVSAYEVGRVKGRGVGNTELISSRELLRAACCNLGESFTTNPSVDVNYADAATGAQQIKLLGLSGTYVQMLTENIPNHRGAAAPYSLGFIPGPWMQSIQVSKGASSVKNGYESITGQINVEFKKPQGTPFVDANLFYNTKGKVEACIGLWPTLPTDTDESIGLNRTTSIGWSRTPVCAQISMCAQASSLTASGESRKSRP
jgi:hypothetical protein